MTLDKSLRIRRGSVKSRNVLKRGERIAKLKEAERWEETMTVLGLPKVKVIRLTMKKKKKKKEEEAEGAEGAAAAPGAAAPAAGARVPLHQPRAPPLPKLPLHQPRVLQRNRFFRTVSLCQAQGLQPLGLFVIVNYR